MGCWADSSGTKTQDGAGQEKSHRHNGSQRERKFRIRLLPSDSEHALGVKLDPLDGKAAMAQTHDGPIAVAVLHPGADFQLLRQTFFGNDERVIAGTGHGAGKAGEEIASIVLYRAGFAVHQLRSAHHVAAEGSPDRLVAQANPIWALCRQNGG